MRVGLAVVSLALCAVPTAAHAQRRLDLTEIPEVSMYEAIWPRGYQHDGTLGVVGSFGVGFGRVRPDNGTAAAATAAVGIETDTVLAVARSELVGFADDIEDLDVVRGHHRGLVQVTTGEDLGLRLSLGGVLDHGDAAGLAPAHLGSGRRTTGDARAEGIMMFTPDNDMSPALGVRGDAGTTRWPDGSRADRLAVGLGFGVAPADGELPRGMLDFVHARVEHTSITAPIAFAATPGLRTTSEVREVEVGLGSHDMTLNIDHELAVIIAGDFGWAWLEAETPAGHLTDNMFRMRLGVDGMWADRDRRRLSHIGIGIGREPGHTPDGTRLVGDWRLELAGDLETRQAVFGARGGISWLSPHQGGAPASTLIRYGTQVEAFFKVACMVQVGGYYAAHYESGPGDPWASSRQWGVEGGLMVRVRTDMAKRSSRSAYPSGY